MTKQICNTDKNSFRGCIKDQESDVSSLALEVYRGCIMSQANCGHQQVEIYIFEVWVKDERCFL